MITNQQIQSYELIVHSWTMLDHVNTQNSTVKNAAERNILQQITTFYFAYILARTVYNANATYLLFLQGLYIYVKKLMLMYQDYRLNPS